MVRGQGETQGRIYPGGGLSLKDPKGKQYAEKSWLRVGGQGVNVYSPFVYIVIAHISVSETMNRMLNGADVKRNTMWKDLSIVSQIIRVL